MQRNNRRALALPMVFVLIVIVGISIGGLYFLMQSGLRRTSRMRQATEHLYLGEAILAKIVNQLKKTPWEMRYYAIGKAPPASDLETGSYRGADYVAVIEDVQSAGTVVPNLSDVLLRVTYNDITRNFFARVSVGTPTVLRPTNVNVERLSPVKGDITSAAVRANEQARANKEAKEAAKLLAEKNAIVRLSNQLRTEGKSLYEIQQQITGTNLDGVIAAEEAVLEKWNAGFAAAASAEPSKYAVAYDHFKAAYDLSQGQAELHKQHNAPRSLYHMARARAGEYEARMLAITDPLAHPKDDPMVRAILEEGIAHLDTLLSQYPDCADAPYALLAKAKYLQRLGDSSGAKTALQTLENDYPNLHLWGEDQTIVGKSSSDGVVTFQEALLDEEGDFFLSKAERPDEVGQIYFTNEDGDKYRVTNDPRPKDCVTVSPDGARVAYRAKMPDGSYRLVVVDRDGNCSSDVTWSNGDWRPFWAAAIEEFEWTPVYLESLPNALESTNTIDLSGIPITGGPFNTIEELRLYGETLYATLTATPYSVDPANLQAAKHALKKGKHDVDKGKGDKPPKKKKHCNKKGTNKLAQAVVFMEQIKAAIDGGDTSWQSPLPPPSGGGLFAGGGPFGGDFPFGGGFPFGGDGDGDDDDDDDDDDG